MGSAHDHANGSSALSYSFGYWVLDSSFRTVMAYDCPTGDLRAPYSQRRADNELSYRHLGYPERLDHSLSRADTPVRSTKPG